MFRGLRLFVNLLEDLLDVASLVAIVGVTEEYSTEERVLLAPLRAFHLVAGEVGARVRRELRDASFVLPNQPVYVWVSDCCLHFHCHEVVVDGLLLGHVRLVCVINLVSKWLVDLGLHQSRLITELLVDFLEILLARLDEVLLFGARPVGLLCSQSTIAGASCNIIAILKQVHFKLILGLQQVLRNISWVLLEPSILIRLQILRRSLRQDRLVALPFEGLQLLATHL